MDLTTLPTVRVQGQWWLSEYCPSEVLDSEESLEIQEIGDFGAYAADFEDNGDWDLSDLTGGPDLAPQASIRVDYDQL